MTPNQEAQQRIRGYLLGKLPDGSREEFERDLMVNDGVFTELLIMEDELTDEYVSDSLDPDDRGNFETHFLASPERQDSLRFAQALNRYVTTHTSRQQEITQTPVPGFFSGRTRFVRFAVAVAVLAMIASALWFFLPRQTSPRTFATLTLSIAPNTRGQEGQVAGIRLPLDKDALRIFLRLPNPSAPPTGYRVQLLAGSGESRSLNIAGQDSQAVVVEIPGAQLRLGEYALSLFIVKADGTEQRINGSYYFTVE
jgi:hypothetical protein